MKREKGSLYLSVSKMGDGKVSVVSLLESPVGRNSRDVSGVRGGDWVLALRRLDFLTL